MDKQKTIIDYYNESKKKGFKYKCNICNKILTEKDYLIKNGVSLRYIDGEMACKDCYNKLKKEV